jgi:hypothetical protein
MCGVGFDGLSSQHGVMPVIDQMATPVRLEMFVLCVVLR